MPLASFNETNSRLVRSRTPPFSILAVGYHKLEDVFIIPVIKAEDEFIQVGLKVLCRYAVIDADNCSLEQAPEVFDAHCVNVSIDECLGMANGFMLSVASGLSVALEFIGDKQFGIDTNEGIKEWSERIGFEVLHDLGHNVTAPLLEPYDDLLAGSATATLSSRLLATDVSVIGFDNTTEFVLEGVVSHGFADLLRHTPCCLVGNTESSLKLFSRDTFLVATHQPDGNKPLLERCPGAVEDRTRCDRELVSASRALPHSTFFDPIGVFGSASGASNAFGPTLVAKEDLALVLGRESFLEFENIHA